METKQKMFRFTPRTVDLLKIVAGLNQLSETEMLEVALEAIASPEALQLINSIHGDRVNRKSLRKPRTTKPKVNHAPREHADKHTERISSIIERAKGIQVKYTYEDENKVQEKEIIKDTSQIIEEVKEVEETHVVSLDTCDDELLRMYG